MRITAITIENFKGISNPVRVELKPITLLFGANSVGKSTIVQALHYVREILERNNVDADRCLGADESMDLGGFKNLVYGHDLNRSIRFKIEMTLNPFELPETQTIERNDYNLDTDGAWAAIGGTAWNLCHEIEINSVWIELEIVWSNLLDKPILKSYSTGFNGHPFAQILCNDDNTLIRISMLNRHPSFIVSRRFSNTDKYTETDIIFGEYDYVVNKKVVGTGKNFKLLLENQRSVMPNWGKPLEMKQNWYKKQHWEGPGMWPTIRLIEAYTSQLLVGPGELLLKELKKVRYIGPIRKIPPRGYTPPRQNDETRWASGLAAWDLLQKSKPELASATSDWLSGKDRLNSGYSLRVFRYKKLDTASDLYQTLLAKGVKGKSAVGKLLEDLPEEKQLLLTDERRGLDVLPQDVGIGISQILPVVVGALDDDTGILMVEQPELHIHPGLQCNLGDLFISQIQKEGKTFIIETHSEHLLLRLLRRIRENNDDELPEGVTGLTPEQVSVNYVELTEEGLRIRPMHISEDGDSLGEWPRGFFEERAKELV